MKMTKNRNFSVHSLLKIRFVVFDFESVKFVHLLMTPYNFIRNVLSVHLSLRRTGKRQKIHDLHLLQQSSSWRRAEGPTAPSELLWFQFRRLRTRQFHLSSFFNVHSGSPKL